MDGGFLFFAVICFVVFGALGYRIGEPKGLAGLGVALGGLLGPIGLIIIAILPNEDVNRINEPQRYPRPAPQLVFEDEISVPRVVPSVKRSFRYFIYQPGKEEIAGPYDEAQIESLRGLKIITNETLFCLEGTQGWLKKSP